MIRKPYISVVISIILALSIWFMVLDFSRFISFNYRYDIYPSAILKRINVLLASFIAWSVGKDAESLRGAKIMKAAFVLVCMGEAAFAIGQRVTGVGMFALCQTLLIVRNSTGFSFRLAQASYKQKKRLLLSGIIVSLILVTLLLMAASLINLNSSYRAIYIYEILLSASLLAGLACNILGLLPQKNARLVAAGMLCFYCCDVLVGLDAVLKPGLPWLLSNSFIWVFYIPALVLLALSCYRYD